MITIKEIVKSRKIRRLMMYGLKILPDRLYISLFYFSVFNKFPNFKNPQGFNEKQNWLKLYNKHPEYADLVDKYKVRDHINSVLGSEYLFPLIGQWKSFDEINFDSLPNKFVLKCNHDSGSVKIIKDKSKLNDKDFNELKHFFNSRMSKDFFYAGREYPYKNIERRIIAEKYMCSSNGSVPNDYKFFCFNGEPKIMFVATDREKDCKFDFYDMDFNHLDIYNLHPNSDTDVCKPVCFDEMIEIAKRISIGMEFVRVDLFELEGRVYFGEYTFFHGGGFAPFYPEKWELLLGSWINLKIDNK